MWTVAAAIERVLTSVPAPSTERVDTLRARGRALAEHVVARVDVPAWDCSAMDGYAVRAADLAGEQTTLGVLEVVPAGRVPTVAVGAGQATMVMTGAPMPEGADAVVPVEDSDRATEGVVTLRGATERGRYVRLRGADLRMGEVVIEAGTRLAPAHLGLAASQGYASLPVGRRPRVGFLSTGDELVQPGEPLGPGQIWSSNHASILALAEEAGADVVHLGAVADDPAALRAALEAADGLDVVITTGGVSAGLHDHVRPVLVDMGAEIAVFKVRMKPGMPFVFAVRPRGGVLFGLPGNPVSCMVNFLLFVRPWLLRFQGFRRVFLGQVRARLDAPLRSAPGRARFERVSLRQADDRWIAVSTGDQSSGVLRSMGRADGLVVLPPEVDQLPAGGEVDVLLLHAPWLDQAEHGLRV
jgi:molybdopterin molybdotransferase